MLRTTVSRGFSARDGQKTAAADPAPPRGRIDAVERLFTQLREELERRVTAYVATTTSSEGPTLLRLSEQRKQLDGNEFVLETPTASFRILNSMEGTIRIFVIEQERWILREILSVHRTEEGYQLIRKPVTGRRSGFAYTSVPALAADFLAGPDRRNAEPR